MDDTELLARKIRSAPDSELGMYRTLCPDLWQREIEYRFAQPAEDRQIKRQAAAERSRPATVPEPAAAPAVVEHRLSKVERDAMWKVIAKILKEYVAEQLAPLQERLATLEAHTEAEMDCSDHLREAVKSLEDRVRGLSANIRRGIVQ